MTRRGSLIRQIALALVTVRTLAFAVAPVLDSHWATRAPELASSAVEVSWDEAAHDPATCPACLLLVTPVWDDALVAGRASFTAEQRVVPGHPTFPGSRVESQTVRSRAPPAERA